MQGLCSVIMPVYNSEKYVSDAIESVLSQTYSNLELIIIDDCSTDNTMNILSSYSKQDTRIKIIRSEKNSGCAASRNKGLRFCKGNYIAFIDSDDVWAKEKLEKQLRYMENNLLNMTFTSYNIINSDGIFLKTRKIKDVLTFEDLLKENSIIFSTTIFNKNAVNGLTFKDEWFHEDYVYLLDYLEKNNLMNGLSDCLVNYRVHNQGRSYNKVKSAIFRWKIYREYLQLDLIEALKYFIIYTVKGIIKYS